MPHNSLINGASHGISSAQTIINGTGYKINSGKTLINGTGHNIAFIAPKTWVWNRTIATPSTTIRLKANSTGDIAFFAANLYDGTMYTSLSIFDIQDIYHTCCLQYILLNNSGILNVYEGEWKYRYDLCSRIEFVNPPEGELLAYLQANATPIYN